MSKRRESGKTGSIFGSSRALIILVLLAFLVAASSATELAAFAAITALLMGTLNAWGRLGLWRLDIELSCDSARLYSGETMTLRAAIANRKALPVWIRIELDRPEALMPDPAPVTTGGIVSESGLLPFSRTAVTWTLRARRRGLHTLGPAKVVAGDLLGLADRGRPLPFRHDIVVFPRLAILKTPALPFSDYFGINRTKGLVEDPAWYEGTREYTGDRPARNIHWKASARLGTLQEKIFEPTAHQKIIFLFDGTDFLESADADLFERALEILASLASRYAEAGSSIAIATDRVVKGFSAVLPLGRGPEHLGSILELLARCENRRGQSIIPLLHDLGPGGADFIVLCRSGGDPTAKYATLPTKSRERVLFIMAEAGEFQEIGRPDTWTSTCFEDLCLTEGDES